MNIDNKIWHSETNYYCEENDFNKEAETELLPGTDILVYNEESQRVVSAWFVNDTKQFIKYTDAGGGSKIPEKYYIYENATGAVSNYANYVDLVPVNILHDTFKNFSDEYKKYYNKLRIEAIVSLELNPQYLRNYSHFIEWDNYYKGDIISTPVPLGSDRSFSKDHSIDYNNLYGICLRFQCHGASGYQKGTYTINYKNFNMYLYHV